MARTFLIVALVCVTGMVSADSSHPAYFYPVEHRGDLRPYQEAIPFPSNNYDLQIIPNDQYPVEEYDTLSFSLWDLIPSPISVLITVGSKALSVAKCVISKGALVLLGVALVLGFCAFTPYCTLIIEKPFSRELRSLSDSIPYMDDVENFLSAAYNKYESLQYA